MAVLKNQLEKFLAEIERVEELGNASLQTDKEGIDALSQEIIRLTAELTEAENDIQELEANI